MVSDNSQSEYSVTGGSRLLKCDAQREKPGDGTIASGLSTYLNFRVCRGLAREEWC